MDTAEAWRLARGTRCDCKICYYCDREVGGRHEHDHFPVPKVANGTDVVPACLDCHDLKDRYSLAYRWPINGYHFAMNGLLREAISSIEGRASGPKFAELLMKHPLLTDEAVLARWSDLPPLSRVLYGKMRSMHEEEIFRQRQDGCEVHTLSTLAAAVRLGSTRRVAPSGSPAND